MAFTELIMIKKLENWPLPNFKRKLASKVGLLSPFEIWKKGAKGDKCDKNVRAAQACAKTHTWTCAQPCNWYIIAHKTSVVCDKQRKTKFYLHPIKLFVMCKIDWLPSVCVCVFICFIWVFTRFLQEIWPLCCVLVFFACQPAG